MLALHWLLACLITRPALLRRQLKTMSSTQVHVSACVHTCQGPAQRWAPAAFSEAPQSPGCRPRRRGRGPPSAAAQLCGASIPRQR